MPYKRKEDKAAQMRRYRFRKKIEAIYQKHLSALEQSPEYLNASSQIQALTKQHFLQMKQLVVDTSYNLDKRLEEPFPELKIQVPVIVQRIYRAAYKKVEKERKALVDKELRRIVDGLTDDQKFELWKIVQNGKFAEGILTQKKTEETQVKVEAEKK